LSLYANKKRSLINSASNRRLQILNDYGIFSLQKAIVQNWSPYATDPDNTVKMHFLVTDATFKLNTDTEIELLKFKKAFYLDDITAKLHREQGVPFYHIEKTDLYSSKLEYDATKERIKVPRDLEVGGLIVRYNEPVIPSIVLRAVHKFSNDEPATFEQVCDWVCNPYPRGGGWLTSTVGNLMLIKESLQRLVRNGYLDYYPDSEKYQIVKTIGGETKVV